MVQKVGTKNWYKWYKKLVQKTGTNGTKKIDVMF